ncbi:10233_t:CDS:2, partial [Paraglomus occultum]
MANATDAVLRFGRSIRNKLSDAGIWAHRLSSAPRKTVETKKWA